MEKKIELNVIAQMLRDPDFDRVLVACHASPDGDACGSAFSLSYALRKMGKKALVFCPDPFPADFSYITREEEGLEAFEPKHFVTVDIAAPSMLAGADFGDRIEIVIDHHRVNTVEGKVKYVCQERASCGEIVLDLIRLMEVPFDAYLARALYTAIATDTGCFRYSNTNEKTFLSAAFLYPFAEERDFYRINKNLFETKTRNRMKLESFAAEKVEFYGGGKCAFLSISLEKQRELGATYQDLECMINVIRQVQGVVVSLVAKEKEEGVFKVSVRSEEGFDASRFCVQFGGGGHVAAAGCTVNGREEEVKMALLEEVERRLS